MNKFENVEQVLRNLEKLGVSAAPYEVRAILESAAERPLSIIKAGIAQNGIDPEAYDFVRKNDGKFTNKKNVSVLMGVDWSNQEAYLVNWMEYGTAPRFKKDGSSTGQIVARSVIRRTWDSLEASIRSEVEEGIMDLIILEGRKHGF